MNEERLSGVLLHPTSLPGKYGIGSLGKPACEFLDWLASANQRLWQILPLGPTGYADSPYQCFSAHAGNPNLIDLDELVAQGFLQKTDLGNLVPDYGRSVDYDRIQLERKPLLSQAFINFNIHARQPDKLKYRNFIKDHQSWLNDYALFMAIKNHFQQKPWYKWDDAIRCRKPEALKSYQEKLHEQTEYQKFLQFLFFSQWQKVKDYAHKKKIRIIGDIPLYVAMDSADAWSEPHLFEFDDQHTPLRVGGVPPDYFSETGQLWGNPLYRWDVLKENGYLWWVERIRTNLLLFDIIRIDHFRGFEAYWAVPYGEKTAVRGEWIPGPGAGFFDAMNKALGNFPLIAEDLGVMTPGVEKLRDSFGFPGMKILEFAFDSSEANDYLPHNYPGNCIVYTGTHDNDTVAGWFRQAGKEDCKHVLEYMDTADSRDITWKFIRLAWASVARTAIVPMQDLLSLGTEARMNLPGTVSGNWKWRSRAGDFTPELSRRLADLGRIYGRNLQRKKKPT